jgi:hypothetical protein
MQRLLSILPDKAVGQSESRPIAIAIQLRADCPDNVEFMPNWRAALAGTSRAAHDPT